MALEETYKVKVDVFEGPMDLLVHLIKKADVDIYDIPISLITEQFLAYLNWLKTLNIDVAGDFLLMASTLTRIKSRMLLPATFNGEDGEDPRMEIIRPILEYLQIKDAAEQLKERNILGEDIFSRTPDKKELISPEDREVISVGLFELVDAFQQVIDNLSPEQMMEITPDRISVKDRITEIVDMLEVQKTITFPELFADNNKSELIITFLALLEMVKLGLVRLAQHVQSGIIRIFYI